MIVLVTVSQTAVDLTLRGPCRQKRIPQALPHLIKILSVT